MRINPTVMATVPHTPHAPATHSQLEFPRLTPTRSVHRLEARCSVCAQAYARYCPYTCIGANSHEREDITGQLSAYAWKGQAHITTPHRQGRAAPVHYSRPHPKSDNPNESALVAIAVKKRWVERLDELHIDSPVADEEMRTIGSGAADSASCFRAGS